MAYLTFTTPGRDPHHLPLTDRPFVVGRSNDCDACLHDILLSRRHCRLTPTPKGWLLIDLASRNGTFHQNRQIEQRMLRDGDVFVVGKTRISYHATGKIPITPKQARPLIPPVVDSGETMTGLAVEPDGESSTRGPIPRPRPRDPASFDSEEIYSMVDQIVSSSWDSIYAMNSRPLARQRLNPPTPRPRMGGQLPPNPPGAAHRSTRASLELQAAVVVAADQKLPAATLLSVEKADLEIRVGPSLRTAAVVAPPVPIKAGKAVAKTKVNRISKLRGWFFASAAMWLV